MATDEVHAQAQELLRRVAERRAARAALSTEVIDDLRKGIEDWYEWRTEVGYVYPFDPTEAH
jgi:hypothetical protein